MPRAPRELNTNQIDPSSGELHWPGYLQDARFRPQGAVIGECAADWVRYGELSNIDQVRMRENIAVVYAGLRSEVNELPPQEYVACRSFLESLLFATTKAML